MQLRAAERVVGRDRRDEFGNRCDFDGIAFADREFIHAGSEDARARARPNANINLRELPFLDRVPCVNPAQRSSISHNRRLKCPFVRIHVARECARLSRNPRFANRARRRIYCRRLIWNAETVGPEIICTLFDSLSSRISADRA